MEAFPVLNTYLDEAVVKKEVWVMGKPTAMIL